jgi:hypothetical protein
MAELPTGIVMKMVGCKLFGIIEHYRNWGIDESSTGISKADAVAEKRFIKAE